MSEYKECKMRHLLSLCRRFLLLSLLFFIGIGEVIAQPSINREEMLSGEINVRPRYVKNASGVPDESLQINETQTEFGARLASVIETEFTNLDLGYDYTETKFNKNTQPDDAYWQGSSTFTFGSDSSFYEISANHSIRRLLSSPGLAPLVLTNSDSRQIATVSPLVRTRLGEANVIELAYNYSEVSFDDSTTNDSTRKGVDLVLTRDVSPIRDISLVLESREIDYETSDVADYDYVSADLLMRVEHRNFDYSVRVGSTKIMPVEGGSVTSPTMDITINTDFVGNRVSVFANRLVSDSSLGNGNSDFFSTEVSFDSDLQQRDQVERTALGISWSYDQLCQNCSVSSSIGGEEVEYVNLSSNDSRQNFFDVSFSYQFSESLSAFLSTRVSNTRFDPSSPLSNAKSMISRVEFSYAYNRYLDFTLAAERDTRDNDNASEFNVDSISLNTTLGFD